MFQISTLIRYSLKNKELGRARIVLEIPSYGAYAGGH